MEISRFEQLGKKVGDLLARVDELTRTKTELGLTLLAKDQEISSLTEKIATLEQERAKVRNMVDEILDRIETHESGPAGA